MIETTGYKMDDYWFDRIWDEVSPFMLRHFEEFNSWPGAGDMDLDKDLYRRMGKLGLLHTIVARKAGKLAGYHWHFLRRHVHRKLIVSSDTVLYAVPGPDRPMVVIALLRKSLDYLKNAGVGAVTMRTKSDHDFGRTLEALGLHAMETVYTTVFRKE